jgi:hypothetical protein
MNPIILAAEGAEAASTAPAGDDFMTLALIVLGAAMLIAALATWVVTPRGEHH